MKKLFLLLTGLLGLLHAHSQAITSDATFAGKGWTYTDFEKGNYYFEYGQQVLLQKDGAYLLVFEVQSVMVLARYLPNGELDASFGTEGYMESGISSAGGPMASKCAQQSDGKIVMAGRALYSYPADFTLARYTVNGAPDSSFGKDGIVSSDLGGSDNASFVAVDPDDRILVAGYIYTESEDKYEFVLTRYDKEGVLDKGFGSDGKVSIEVEGYAENIFMAVQSDGKLVVAGNVLDSNTWSYYLLVARYNPNGSPDVGFDEDGKLVTDFFNSSNVTSLAVQSDGKIVLAGGTNLSGETSDFALRRYNTDGSLDSGFGDGGNQSTDFGGEDFASSLAVQSDGKIVVAGIASFFNIDNANVALARYQEDGSPDASFDGDGKVTTDFGDLAFAYSLAVQSDGKIVVAGITVQLDTPDMDYALARYNTDGSLDSGFDSDGKLTGYYPAGFSQISSLAVQKDGKIIAAGLSGIPGLYRFRAATLFRQPTAAAPRPQLGADAGLARYNADGSLDPSFGEKGMLVLDLGGMEEATSLIVQEDGKILIAGSCMDTEGNIPLLFLARINADGSSDNSFDGDGKLVTSLYTLGADHSLALQSDGKIVVAGIARIKDGTVDFVVARYLPDGSPDHSFDGDGVALADFGNPAGAFSLAIQADGKIVVAGLVENPNSYTIDLALARFNADGSLDGSFDGDGQLTTDPVDGAAYSLAIQADGKIVVAAYTFGFSPYPQNTFLVRYNQDGALDSSFNGDGWLTTDFFGGGGVPGVVTPSAAAIGISGPSVAIQSNGKIVMGGATYDPVTNRQAFGLIRYHTDGSIDSSFGNRGTMLQNFTKDDDIATSLFITSERIYQAGYSDGPIARGIVAAYRLDCGDTEICGNRLDDNCDGQVDEGCSAQPFLTINDVTGSEDLQRATLMVTLSKKMEVPVSFSYFTVDRTATSKPNKKGVADYVAKSGTLTIPAGQQTAVISIPIIDDNSTEGEEYFDVHLQRPVGAALAGDKGRVTIQDGEPSVGIFVTTPAPEKETLQKLSATARPNPSAGAFILVLQSPDRSPVVIKVTDAAGRLVEAKAGITSNSTLHIGSNYRPGVYYAEVVQGSERVNLKLVKQ